MLQGRYIRRDRLGLGKDVRAGQGDSGQVEAGTSLPEGERAGEAAHRLIQLFHQRRHQTYRQSQ